MRATVRTARGISFTKDHPHPVTNADNALKSTDVLIKVKSAAINPADYKLPRIIAGKVVGVDVSGVVEKVGHKVSSEFKVGDGVYGMAVSSKGGKLLRGKILAGSLADYTLVDAKELAKKSDYLSFDEAAALPIAYLTGIQSLRRGNVKKGSSVLVIGASGGCGLAGVQLASAMKSSRVVGICSGKNFEFVRDMCDGWEKAEDLELVDYTDGIAFESFRHNNVGKFDCIYDTVTGSGKGENYTTTMMPLLKEGTGQYVQLNGPPSTWIRHFLGRMKPQTMMIMTANNKSDLEAISSLLEMLGVKPHLNVNMFDEKGVADGFAQLKGRRTKGKIVFHIND